MRMWLTTIDCWSHHIWFDSIQGLGRSHPNQQKEQQLFELPSAEIKLIVLQSSAGDVGLQAYHKPLLYELAVFGLNINTSKILIEGSSYMCSKLLLNSICQRTAISLGRTVVYQWLQSKVSCYLNVLALHPASTEMYGNLRHYVDSCHYKGLSSCLDFM